MTKGSGYEVLDYIRQLAGLAVGQDLTDRRLLERFAAAHDEAAFATLVQRHGALVWGVCRRILGRVEDAEDAFQATFLVLARKAGRLRWHRDVGNWLYAVAWRTARKAQTAAARRQRQERQLGDMPAREATGEGWGELGPVLDEELNRLPRKYRAPLVLHYLEGKTYVQAAQALGWPEGTVAARLARARQMLRRRLTRRGLGLSTGLLAALLAENGAAAVVPPLLRDATVKAAALFAAGQVGMAGLVSAKVAALTEGVLQAMFLSQLRIITALGLLMGALGLGAGVLSYQGLAAAPGHGPERIGPPVARAETDPPQDDALKQEVEQLKRENERLSQEVRQLREHMAALERKLAPGEEAPQPILYQGKPTSYWLKQLKDRDTTYRSNAIQALGAIAVEDKTLLPVLSKELRDPAVTFVAGSALASIGKDAVPVLLQAWKGQNYQARSAAVNGLAQMGPNAKDAVPALIASLKDENDPLRGEAASALGRIGPAAEGAIPVLIRVLNDKDTRVRDAAILALASFRAAAVPALSEALKSKEDAVRAGAAKSLESIIAGSVDGSGVAKKAIPALIRALGDRDQEVRTQVSLSFCRLGAEAVPALIEALKDKDPARRAGAAYTLGLIGAPRANPALSALAKARGAQNENEKVREAAARAMRRLAIQPPRPRADPRE